MKSKEKKKDRLVEGYIAYGFKRATLVVLGCIYDGFRFSTLWYRFNTEPAALLFPCLPTMAPTGMERMRNRKSAKSLPASAKKTLLPCVSTNSFRVNLEEGSTPPFDFSAIVYYRF
ncbi:serine/threonine transporter SstT [Striga asiatica]|uniref:Serine/threonine transporter SstT n=1 Tax=Striga asiatica TaxID=4170 RepID=A0A5A7QE91_STRAF|nr:serine/threonine transporter SstT [Striga asiatica]